MTDFSSIPLQFDIASVVGLMASGQSLILIVFLLAFHWRLTVAWYLVTLTFSIFLALGHDVLMHSKLALYIPHVLGLGPFSTFLFGPLIFLLVLNVINPARRSRWYDALHFVPFLVHFYERWPSITKPVEQKTSFLLSYFQSDFDTSNSQTMDFAGFLDLVSYYGHRFAYIAVSVYLLTKALKKINEGKKERKLFSHLLLLAITGYCLVWLLVKFLQYSSGTSNVFQLSINAFSLSGVIIVLAVMLMRYSIVDIFSSKPGGKYAGSRLDTETASSLLEEIRKQLTHENWYCQNDLNLTQVANRLGLSTQVISQVINLQTGGSFNDLINDYRLQHVKRLIESQLDSKVDFQTLALQSGFNSKATFNRIFKEKVGMTPTAYKQQSVEKIYRN